MDILIYIIIIILSLRLLMVVGNYFSRPNLPPIERIKDNPLLSILVRADHESARLMYLLELLKKISSPRIEVIIGSYNPLNFTFDNLNRIIDTDDRFSILDIKTLDKNWDDINQMKYFMGMKARGNYILFLDENVELRGPILDLLIVYMRDRKYGMVSVFPSFDIHHPYEWLTLPNLKKMYLSTYPMWLIRDLSFKKFSLQCNDFMLFDGNVYRNFQPFEFSKHDKSKNIAYFLKSEGVKVDYFIGDNRILIDNDGTIKKCLYELINSLNCFLKGKKTIILIYSFIMCFWWVPFIFNFIPGLFILSLIILFASQYFIAYITRSTVSESFIYFIPQFYFLFYSIIRSLLHMRHIKRKASH